MEVVKRTDRYTVFKKRSGRYGVRSAGGAWINGEDKNKILAEEGLIKTPAPKAKEEVSEAENETEETGGDQEASSTEDSSAQA